MTRDEIIETIRAHRAEIDEFGVKRLAIFGAVARDEGRPDSNVDFLVEFENRGLKGFFDRHIGLKFLLDLLIAEAAKKLPDEQRAKYPNAPWKKIAGMRDILIHEHAHIDPREVWAVATEKAPELLEQLGGGR